VEVFWEGFLRLWFRNAKRRGTPTTSLSNELCGHSEFDMTILQEIHDKIQARYHEGSLFEKCCQHKDIKLTDVSLKLLSKKLSIRDNGLSYAESGKFYVGKVENNFYIDLKDYDLFMADQIPVNNNSFMIYFAPSHDEMLTSVIMDSLVHVGIELKEERLFKNYSLLVDKVINRNSLFEDSGESIPVWMQLLSASYLVADIYSVPALSQLMDDYVMSRKEMVSIVELLKYGDIINHYDFRFSKKKSLDIEFDVVFRGRLSHSLIYATRRNNAE
jgi:hypothetical protein